MTQPGTVWGALCAFVLVILGSATARAQNSQIDPQIEIEQEKPSENGIKVGAGRLHPFFDLEVRLDSAVGYFPDEESPDPNAVSEDLSGEVALRLRPGVKLDIPSPKVAVQFSGNLDYVYYTGWMTPESKNASHLEGMAYFNARFNPEGQVNFVLEDQLIRSDQTRNVAVGAGVLSLYNELRASLPSRPGGGAIEVTPELSWGLEYFQPLGDARPVGCVEGVCDPLALDDFDYHNFHLGVDGRWRFLPKTAVVLNTDFDLRHHLAGTTPDAYLLRVLGGVAGLLTPKFSVIALAGWGYDFGLTKGNTFVTQLEANYLLRPTMTLKGGYMRTLSPVSTYGLYRDDRPYFEARALMGGRLALHVTAGLSFLSFYGGAQSRSDTLLDLDMGPEYQFTPWLNGAAGYLLSKRSSSLSGTGLNFTRHEGYVRISVTY